MRHIPVRGQDSVQLQCCQTSFSSSSQASSTLHAALYCHTALRSPGGPKTASSGSSMWAAADCEKGHHAWHLLCGSQGVRLGGSVHHCCSIQQHQTGVKWRVPKERD